MCHVIGVFHVDAVVSMRGIDIHGSLSNSAGSVQEKLATGQGDNID
jgi:hypothetical protein